MMGTLPGRASVLEEATGMSVSCDRRIVGLWANEERSNAWAYVQGVGWRKLDDANDDACTNLLALAAQAKAQNATVKLHEDLRGDRWYITEIYDLSPSTPPAAQEVSFSVAECTFGWTAAFRQQGTNIVARIQLNPDDDVSADLLAEVKDRWKRGIEDKWSYRFRCSSCALTFQVVWTSSSPHLVVRVKKGDGRSNLRLWHTTDSGDVASHEFGHLMGHPDEYAEDDVCPDRSPKNTGTVMDDNTEVVLRLCRPFCDRLGKTTSPA
jgi:hypothetical protein